MKRYLCYFATMLLVLAITDLCLGGELFRFGAEDPYGISVRLSGVESGPENLKELGKLIDSKSCDFVRAAFDRDKAKVDGMLTKDAVYLITEDKSSYIRYVSKDMHVEGYMATDRKLVQVRQSWYVIGDDGTITSAVEVAIEGEKSVQVWYIHYMKSFGQWKIFMLENGV
ncbi:MAG: nuclear transport factor 2 family protein [Clostridia bacterium]